MTGDAASQNSLKFRVNGMMVIFLLFSIFNPMGMTNNKKANFFLLVFLYIRHTPRFNHYFLPFTDPPPPPTSKK